MKPMDYVVGLVMGLLTIVSVMFVVHNTANAQDGELTLEEAREIATTPAPVNLVPWGTYVHRDPTGEIWLCTIDMREPHTGNCTTFQSIAEQFDRFNRAEGMVLDNLPPGEESTDGKTRSI